MNFDIIIANLPYSTIGMNTTRNVIEQNPIYSHYCCIEYEFVKDLVSHYKNITLGNIKEPDIDIPEGYMLADGRIVDKK